MTVERQPGLWRQFSARVREERKCGGWWRAVAAVADDLWEFVRDSTPSRRRQRYGDVEYDWDHGTDTTAANVTGRTRFAGALAGGPYQPVPAAEFHASVGQLPIRYEDFTFVDLGSGKGRALLLAAQYPFRRIVGVELLPELQAAALENLAKCRAAQRPVAMEAVCGDAREYEFPREPLVVFLFNPFPAAVLSAVLDRLENSIREQPRPVFIVYHNPENKRLLDARGAFEEFVATRQFVIHRAKLVGSDR